MSTAITGSLAVTPAYVTASDQLVSWDDPGQTWRQSAAFGGGFSHSVRVRTANAALNAAVANGGILRFDTVDHDSDGYALLAAPFDRLTIPAGLGGLYMLVGWSSGSGTQATTLGMGVLINGSQVVSETNQSLTGPASINYTLDNGAVEIGYLADGSTIQLRNNSVSAGTNAFTSVILTLARLEASGPAGAPGVGALPSTTLPLMDGVAAVGVAATFTRGDHVHPVDTSRAPLATGFTAGSVIFTGAGGVNAQDNANLFWDDANNRLGIGTATPVQPLDVNAAIAISGQNALYTLAGNLTLCDVSGVASISSGATATAYDNANHIFRTKGGVATMFGIATTGANFSVNLGIGTATPSQALDVNGTVALKGHAVLASDASNYLSIFDAVSGQALSLGTTITAIDNWTINFRQKTPGLTYATFDTSNTRNVSGAWAVISARELKQEIAPYKRGLEAIVKLQPCVFRYRAGTPFARADAPSELLIGLMADEVEPVMPELVGETSVEGDERAVAVTTLTPHNALYAMINAIRELAERVERLEKPI